MTEEEFAQLKQSIKEEGQHYPIIANEDLEVLDGHHRFRACTELGIEPDFEVRKFDDKLIEKKFVIEANLRRRHLNNFQLVELAVPLLEIERALAKKRKIRTETTGDALPLGLTPEDDKPDSKATEAVAKKTGLSKRTFERGKRILEEASEEDKQKLREGKASITSIYREVIAPEAEATNVQDDLSASPVADDPRAIKNKESLLALLQNLEENEVFCPSCGHGMFECSKCHKTLRESLGQQR